MNAHIHTSISQWSVLVSVLTIWTASRADANADLANKVERECKNDQFVRPDEVEGDLEMFGRAPFVISPRDN